MSLPLNLERPKTPYTTIHPSGSFDNRYTNLENERLSPRGFELDGDILWLRDTLVDVSSAVNNLVVGVLPGIDEPENKDHFPTTDGASNISWVKIQNFHIEDKTIFALDKIVDLSISTGLLANQCITAVKVRDKELPISKINAESAAVGTFLTVTSSGVVEFNKVKASSLDPEIAVDGTVATITTTNNIKSVKFEPIPKVKASRLDPEGSAIGTVPNVTSNGVVGYSKIKAISLDTQGAAVGSVATVQANSTVAYQAIPISGKILQIQQFVHDTPDNIDQTATNFTSFTNKKFQLSITPLSTNSRIFLNISINLSSVIHGSGFNAPFVMGLYKNNSSFTKFTGKTAGFPGTNVIGGLFGGKSLAEGDLRQFNINLIDDTYTTLNPITYELKGYSYVPNGQVFLNYCISGSGPTAYGAVTVSTIVAMEIEKI